MVRNRNSQYNWSGQYLNHIFMVEYPLGINLSHGSLSLREVVSLRTGKDRHGSQLHASPPITMSNLTCEYRNGKGKKE